jgi:short-subunit dehydrogenase
MMPSSSILITGCSSGIGYAAANLLKNKGYRVFAGVRSEADMERLRALGLESIFMDMSNSKSIQTGLEEVLTLTGGKLDALVNNAAYMQVGALEDLSMAMIRAQFETNFFGAIELTRLVLPVMRKQGHGRIIQISSILGVITMPFYGAYNASKYALEGFTNTLRQELRDSNIKVSLINPGPITSKLRDRAFDIYQQTIQQNQTNIHQATYEKLKQSYFKPSKRDERFFLTEDAVVKKIIHALESKHPNPHYFVGFPAHLFAILRRMLPDSWLDWVLCSVR